MNEQHDDLVLPVDEMPKDSLLRQLYLAAQSKTPIERKPPRTARGDGTRSRKIMHVSLGPSPATKLHAASMRAKIIEFIQAQLEQPVKVEVIEEHFGGKSVRGFLQKLCVSGHLEANK